MESIAIGCCVNAGLMALADVSAQHFERLTLRRAMKDEPEINLVRTVRFATVGLLITGPLSVVRYTALSVIFTGAGAIVAVEKMLFNQFVFDPPDTLLRLGFLEYSRSRDLNAVEVKLRRDYWLVQVPAWMVSIPSNLFTFYIVPTVWGQIVVHRAISTCFQVYFSYVANKSLSEGPAVPAPAPSMGNNKKDDGAAEEVPTWRSTNRCEANTDLGGGEGTNKASHRRFFFDVPFLRSIACWGRRN